MRVTASMTPIYFEGLFSTAESEKTRLDGMRLALNIVRTPYSIQTPGSRHWLIL